MKTITVEQLEKTLSLSTDQACVVAAWLQRPDLSLDLFAVCTALSECYDNIADWFQRHRLSYRNTENLPCRITDEGKVVRVEMQRPHEPLTPPDSLVQQDSSPPHLSLHTPSAVDDISITKSDDTTLMHQALGKEGDDAGEEKDEEDEDDDSVTFKSQGSTTPPVTSTTITPHLAAPQASLANTQLTHAELLNLEKMDIGGASAAAHPMGSTRRERGLPQYMSTPNFAFGLLDQQRLLQDSDYMARLQAGRRTNNVNMGPPPARPKSSTDGQHGGSHVGPDVYTHPYLPDERHDVETARNAHYTQGPPPSHHYGERYQYQEQQLPSLNQSMHESMVAAQEAYRSTLNMLHTTINAMQQQHQQQQQQVQQMLDIQQQRPQRQNPLPQARQVDAVRGLPRPEFFDGTKPWKPFYSQFSRRVRLMDLNHGTALDHLVLCLTGQALSYYDSLSLEVRASYQLTTDALSKRFSEALSKHGHRLRFHALIQTDKETTAEFADRVRRVAQDAYPDVQEDFRQTEMINRFLLGMSCREASLATVHKEFHALDEAVQFVELFLEHRKALAHMKNRSASASAYATWSDDGGQPTDTKEVFRSQMNPNVDKTAESMRDMQKQLDDLRKQMDQMMLLLNKQHNSRADQPHRPTPSTSEFGEGASSSSPVGEGTSGTTATQTEA